MIDDSFTFGETEVLTINGSSLQGKASQMKISNLAINLRLMSSYKLLLHFQKMKYTARVYNS